MPFQFQVTADYSLVELILSNPRAYKLMANDEAPKLECFRAVPGNYTPVICRSDDGMLAGLFILAPVKPGEAQVHFCFTPNSRWKMVSAGKAFIEWVWRETPFCRLLGPCPSYNRLALRTAKRCGFKPAWTEYLHLRKNGQTFNLIVTAVRRPD